MGDVRFVDNMEQYIDRMVMCENMSRLTKNYDNLANTKNEELSNIRIRNPTHALHLILHGINYDFNPQVKADCPQSLQAFMGVLYELETHRV